MRKSLAILGFLSFGSFVLAQTTGKAVHLNPAGQQNPTTPPAIPAPVKLDPTNNRLDALLLQWEQKMKGIASLEATVIRTETDPIDKTVQEYRGTAKFMRPDRAYLYLQKVSKPEVYEQYIFTGTYLYEYRPQTKQVRIHEMAQKPGQIVDDNFLNFLFGLKADEAKRRYELSLAKEDQNYVYMFVNPQSAADRAEFSKARLVLWANSYLPRQLEFEIPNGGVVKWDIPKIDPAAKITAADFNPPKPPSDWQVQRIPRQTAGAIPVPNNPPQPPPTKVRPAGSP